MGRKNKRYCELRTRQQIDRKTWMKKSRFYLLGESTRVIDKALRRQGNGNGTSLISLQKVPKEKLLGEFPKSVAQDILQSQKELSPKRNGFGDFLRLGDVLLKELRGDENKGEVFDGLAQLNMVSKQKRIMRRGYYDRERKKATY